VTEKLKTDIERLKDDFAKANIEAPGDMVEFFELLRDEIEPQPRSGGRVAEKSKFCIADIFT
jgi:hypothetical protein